MSCILVLGINDDFSGEPSILFEQLTKALGRKRAVAIYTFARDKTIQELLKGDSEVERNSQGEPTLYYVIQHYKNFFTDLQNVKAPLYEKEAGAVDSNGNTRVYGRKDSLMKCQQFNREQVEKGNTDVLAYPVLDEEEKNGKEDKWHIEVGEASVQNITTLKEATFNDALNEKLLQLMRKLGFTVNEGTVDGRSVFDPKNPLKMADNLISVIKIAAGEKGEAEFPEEFSHFIIEGLQNSPLVKRLLESLTANENLRRQVLGDNYELYNKLYEGNIERLAKEAAGQLLAMHIQGKSLPNATPRTLLQRIWDFIKNIFSKVKEKDVNDLISEANALASEINRGIQDESILQDFDKNLVLMGDMLYHAEDKLKEIATTAFETLAKYKALKQQSGRRSTRLEKEDYITVANIQDSIESENYASGCVQYLTDTANQINHFEKTLMHSRESLLSGSFATKDFEAKVAACANLRNLRDFIQGNRDILIQMSHLKKLVELGEVTSLKIGEDDKTIAQIQDMANEILQIVNLLDSIYSELRLNFIYHIFREFVPEEITFTTGKMKGKTITLMQMLEMADKDITFWESYIGAMADSSDLLSAAVDKCYKVLRARRDIEVRLIADEIAAIDKTLKNAGVTDTRFMYEYDSKGVPTGRIISNIDWDKFEEDKKRIKDEIRVNDTLTPMGKRKAFENWLRENTEEIKIAGVKQVVPKARDDSGRILYFKDNLSKLTVPQRAYYDAIMKVKARMEGKLPEHRNGMFKAVMINNDFIDAVRKGMSVKDLIKNGFGDMFTNREDEVELIRKDSDLTDDDELETGILMSMSGDELRKVPIYYTRRLKNMKRLCTDFTGTLMSFAASTINYEHMSKVASFFELTQDLVEEREVQQYRGKTPIEEIFRIAGQAIKNPAVVKGGNIAERMRAYIDVAIYDMCKLDEGTISILNKEIEKAKLGDFLKNFTSHQGLGFNVFSGLSNAAVGKIQIAIETTACDYFGSTPKEGLKNSIKGKEFFWKNVMQVLAESNATVKTNILSVLMRVINPEENFEESLQGAAGKYEGGKKKFLRSMNDFFMQGMGEFYLHARTMLGMLYYHKVKLDGKEVSIMDAIDVCEIKDAKGDTVAATIVFKNGVTDLNGNKLMTDREYKRYWALKQRKDNKEHLSSSEYEEFYALEDKMNTTNDLFIKESLRIQRVNQKLNGAFNKIDRGTINRHVLGRLIMNFRQWMPAHYARRFGSAKYDFILDKETEGFYVTFWRILGNFAKNLVMGKFHLAVGSFAFKNMSEVEKCNMRRAYKEYALFVALIALSSTFAAYAEGDDDDRWKRMFYYQLLRMKVEVGASAISTDFLDNTWTILKSPAASIQTLESLGNLLHFTDIWKEIETGRYKGDSVYKRNFIKNLIWWRQYARLRDLTKETYMFNIYK